jgi:citrate synthase
MTDDKDYLRTRIGWSTADTITVAGRDLAHDLMGNLTLTELAYLLIVGREPTPGERRIVDAVLVSLADHGITPSSLATRLTYTGAPEAVQGAVAAGLLSAGSVFLGPAGDTAQFLSEIITSRADARAAVAALVSSGRRVPGLGHPVHKREDPRTTRLYALAAEEHLLGPHMELLRTVADVYAQTAGRRLPINGAGAAGAALADVGFPVSTVRGVVLIARTAGLVAHLTEEAQHPIGMPLWLEAERRASGQASDA